MAERGRPRCFEREDALRKAMNVFWCKGFEGASLSELTTAMGINSPSLYAAFGSKETLFLEAVELYRQTDGAATRQAFDAGTTAKEAIAALLETSSSCITHKKHNDSLQSHDGEAKSDLGQPTGCMVVLSALHCSNENQKVQEQLSSKRRETEVLIHERLLRGVQDGEISSEANIADIARFYVTILHGMSIQARDGACQDILLTIAKQAMLAWDSLTLETSHEKSKTAQVAELI
ncbi:TetR/AcrR family transcriptional regulator [Aquirhabdus sp.]|uniref:TetR/AcrR family transcriptional regulator n=1 Tax=Aquirhabdus sp. TaxID=2824160 RepID=UPI00396C4360